jgi:hypothetical protein
VNNLNPPQKGARLTVVQYLRCQLVIAGNCHGRRQHHVPSTVHVDSNKGCFFLAPLWLGYCLMNIQTCLTTPAAHSCHGMEHHRGANRLEGLTRAHRLPRRASGLSGPGLG